MEEWQEMRRKGPFLGFSPRPSDVFVAVMGMTGAGKSTFISLCTGQDAPVGHSLQACTQDVTVYDCKWSDTITIYLIDTPGFDDTNRSDTEVLKEIASWFTRSYEDSIKLSGILYLHRIENPRMQGSAKKNLFMFRKLCGNKILSNVLLVSTMWEVLPEVADGCNREKELVETEDFWGALKSSGAEVCRHDNTLDSAMSLLGQLVGSKKVTMSIQDEMVTEHKALIETQAGLEVQAELRQERERFKKEITEAQEMLRDAMEAHDLEAAEKLREHQEYMTRKMDKIVQEREQLKVSMQKMHEEYYARLEKKYEEQLEKFRKENEETRKELERYRQKEREATRQLNLLRQGTNSRPVQKDLGFLEKLLDVTGIRPALKPPSGSAQRLRRPRVPSPVLRGTSREFSDIRRRSSSPLPGRFPSSYIGLASRRKHTNDDDYLSLALSEKAFCFVGPKVTYRQSTSGLNDTIRPLDVIRYVAIGMERSWLLHYHNNGECHTQISKSLKTHYPTLREWLRGPGKNECPEQVSLGPDGLFYLMTKRKEQTHNLPAAWMNDFGDANRVWLGYNRTYVIERRDGTSVMDLQGQYRGLEEWLQTHDIKDLAMNSKDPDSYAAISLDYDAQFSKGTKYPKSETKFEQFVKLNFGKTCTGQTITDTAPHAEIPKFTDDSFQPERRERKTRAPVVGTRKDNTRSESLDPPLRRYVPLSKLEGVLRAGPDSTDTSGDDEKLLRRRGRLRSASVGDKD